MLCMGGGVNMSRHKRIYDIIMSYSDHFKSNAKNKQPSMGWIADRIAYSIDTIYDCLQLPSYVYYCELNDCILESPEMYSHLVYFDVVSQCYLNYHYIGEL